MKTSKGGRPVGRTAVWRQEKVTHTFENKEAEVELKAVIVWRANMPGLAGHYAFDVTRMDTGEVLREDVQVKSLRTAKRRAEGYAKAWFKRYVASLDKMGREPLPTIPYRLAH